MCSHQESESKSVSLTTLETPLLRWEPQRVAGTSSQAAAKRSADMAPHSEIRLFPVLLLRTFCIELEKPRSAGHLKVSVLQSFGRLKPADKRSRAFMTSTSLFQTRSD